jgi:uncharacterized protein (DUF2141 family)
MFKFLKSLSFVFLVFFCQQLHSQTYDLSISIPNLKNKNGEIQVGIYNKAESFPEDDKQYKVIFIKTAEFKGTYTIKGLPKGDYAIALMHDENADKICNMNFLGIPKEGYGFSNNIKPVLSAPAYNDCKIILNQNLSITIKMIY